MWMWHPRYGQTIGGRPFYPNAVEIPLRRKHRVGVTYKNVRGLR